MSNFGPLPQSRVTPRSGYAQLRGGKIIDVEILGETTIDTSGDVNLSGTTSLDPEDWRVPTLLNSWVNYGSNEQTVRYRKDADGVVHVQGVVKSGTTTSATNVFRLPAGYRPTLNLDIAGVANGAFCNMKMQADGYLATRVGWSAGATAFNFTFPTD